MPALSFRMSKHSLHNSMDFKSTGVEKKASNNEVDRDDLYNFVYVVHDTCFCQNITENQGGNKSVHSFVN